MFDYAKLLQVYMESVIAHEGISYIDTHIGGLKIDALSAEEIAELRRIENEIKTDQR